VPYQNLLKTNKNKAFKLKEKLYKYYTNRNVISVSQKAKDSLLNTFQVIPKRIEVVYNGFDFDYVKKMSIAYHPNINHKYIIHVARFDLQMKRQDLLLNAFDKVNANVHLVLLTQPCDELQDLVNNSSKKDKVHIVNFTSNPYPWFKNAELSILCSDYEGLAMVIIESLILRTPVISTDCPSGPGEILTGSMANWLVECNNPELLANKIDRLLLHKEPYVIDDKNLQKFNFSTMQNKIDEIIPQ
jgi:glycosyltransferase involved in cell wall biosynthesis